MRIGNVKTPPSRRGKKQIVAYLSPNLVAAIHARTEQTGTTVQEFIGEAVNEAFRAYGRQPVMTLGHMRLVHRIKSRSKVREKSKVPPCRTGRRALGGWFEERQVRAVSEFAAEVGLKTQDLVELGAKRMIERQVLPVAAE